MLELNQNYQCLIGKTQLLMGDKAMKNRHGETLVVMLPDGTKQIIDELFNMGALQTLLGTTHLVDYEICGGLTMWVDGDAEDNARPLNELASKILGCKAVHGDVLVSDDDYFYK